MTAVAMAVTLAAVAGFMLFSRPEVLAHRSGWAGLGQRMGGHLLDRFRRRSVPDTAEFLGAFAGELSAGQPLAAALAGAAAVIEPVPCPLALRAAESGGDVPAALRLDARADAPELRSLAACWEVAAVSGTGLASAVSRLASTARAAAAARGELTAELAATRASGRLLMLLPVFGILTGIWIGADPIHWFVATIWGRLTLVTGLTLQLVAALWLRRITSRASAVLLGNM
jgi:tight adherence protein B